MYIFREREGGGVCVCVHGEVWLDAGNGGEVGGSGGGMDGGGRGNRAGRRVTCEFHLNFASISVKFTDFSSQLG